LVANPTQADADLDGIGDACEPTTGTVIVKKIVLCESGAQCPNLPNPSLFTMFVSPVGTDNIRFPGSAEGTAIPIEAWLYATGVTIPQPPPAGLTLTNSGPSGECVGSVQTGETKTCTWTNTYGPS
jgi:hypothetical protein